MAADRPRISSLTQALSAAAVVISLVFVGLEVRESARQTALNTQSLQAGAYQDLLGQIMTLNMLSMERPGLNTPSSESSLADLSPSEYEREVNRIYLCSGMEIWPTISTKLGMLPEERLESALGMPNDSICSPLLHESWAMFKDNFVSSYRNFVDAKIASRENC